MADGIVGGLYTLPQLRHHRCTGCEVPAASFSSMLKSFISVPVVFLISIGGDEAFSSLLPLDFLLFCRSRWQFCPVRREGEGREGGGAGNAHSVLVRLSEGEPPHRNKE